MYPLLYPHIKYFSSAAMESALDDYRKRNTVLQNKPCQSQDNLLIPYP